MFENIAGDHEAQGTIGELNILDISMYHPIYYVATV